ncbi:MAG TPA: DUF1343 domain-containing protein [Desulfobacteraceae bacterium]|nr:DUF1343 domain-containing protein [Desulfobacteraceae bacterium]
MTQARQPLIRTGLDTLNTDIPDCLKDRKLGLLANPASVDSRFSHARDVIARRFPGQLAALFSPQHGFFAEKQDNMIESAHGTDPELGIPIYSLYSETRIPTPKMFESIDTLVVDIQDVGTRVYTFIYTIAYCMEVAARLGKSVVILDRPNPVGGILSEGNVLEPESASFVGRFPIPMRHGMTVGEISMYFNATQNIHCDLTVIPMTGWKRQMLWEDTGLTWIPPSPNLPTPLSAAVYPGQVIFEGTNVSEGRGTTLPFEQFGAPYMDARKMAAQLGDRIKGAHLRPVCFEPTSGKWAGRICQGAHIHITRADIFKPYLSSLVFLHHIITSYPDDFRFKSPPYEYEYDRLPMDLILGSRSLCQALEDGVDPRELEPAWQEELNRFVHDASPFYLYD